MKQTEQKVPLKRLIFNYIAVFVAVILIFLWVFQTMFLEAFYEQGVRRTMRFCATQALKEPENFSVQMEHYDMSVAVYDSVGNLIHSYSYFRDNYLESISGYTRAYLYKLAIENGGKRLVKVQSAIPENGAEKPERLIYCKVSEDGNMALVEAMLTPIGGAAETLRVQLMWATALFLLLGSVFAILIARNLSRPLVKINSAAKRLSAGDYQVDFTVSGSREVEELAVTLNQTAQELSRVDGLRKELLANISHDLRTPLTMITAYAEMMRDLPGEQTPENIQVIIDEANRLTALVGDLLDLSRLQSGAHNLTKKHFNITECLRKLLNRYNKLIDQENYDIRFSFDKEVMVHADELKITQVAYNLINNAVNYTGSDKRVDVNQITNGNKVRIEIVDTGAGIPPEELAYIWDRYYRASQHKHCREKAGSGIGLSIVKEVMELHGERYGVESEIGRGSVFWFELSVCSS